MSTASGPQAAGKPPCDLVMKGGVTSGIVYPAAIYQISRFFDIKSVGGTSAGAIAAALTAAAQFRRLTDGDAGYQRLSGLPEFLGSEGRLGKLFAPNSSTKSLFALMARILAPCDLREKILAIVEAYPMLAALGAIPGLLYGIAAWNPTQPFVTAFQYVFVVLVLALGSAAASTAGLLLDLFRRLPNNCYGLVTGVEGNNDLALCTWLTHEIEETAGLHPGEAPLTFGMLWDLDVNAVHDSGHPPRLTERAINLQMVTTSLTEGRPYEFPTNTSRYYFKPDELRPFFPKHVVEWMILRSRKLPADAGPLPREMLPLPPIGDLPIIVATRMSLAFPILLSAVPLYSVDHNDTDPQEPQRVWFSDGGLTSNFPIAMFDAPLPRWPTLAINLGSPAPRKPDELVLLTESTRDGRLLHFQQIHGLLGFFAAIFSTMQNWTDNMQALMPGFRDRIATIVMLPGEGGLNLEMSHDMVTALRERGEKAGALLVERFVRPSVLSTQEPLSSWEGHRWTRLRVAFDTIRGCLAQFSSVWNVPRGRDAAYPDLISGSQHTIPNRSYPLGGGSLSQTGPQQARSLGNAISKLGHNLAAASSIERNFPNPPPILSVRPDLQK